MRLLPALLASSCRWRGPARAQPQDAAPPRADERVIIFFAWDRPVIDGDAAARLERSRPRSQRAPAAALELAGHADRSGPAGTESALGPARAPKRSAPFSRRAACRARR